MKSILILFLSIYCVILHAEDFMPKNDTLQYGDTLVFNTWGERVFTNRWVQSAYIGLPLIAAGFIEKSENEHFRSLRNGFLPRFNHSLDNYLQYSPAAVMLALKACKVPSRSSWNKMLAADAFSIALVTLSTRIIKPLAKEERPDGSNRHSFPSGHTATAFMAATMLNKEYGHLSPWIGFGGYAVATATGVMRMMNNRHWMSDILAGAGFGIIGTEFGYWLSDLAFPSHPKSYDMKSTMLVNTGSNPSFLGIYAGFYVPLKRLKTGRNLEKRSDNGGTFGFEGAYFINRHIGFGGQLSASVFNYILDGEQWIEDNSHFFSAKAGVYYSQDVYQRMYVMGKLLSGYTYYPDINDNICENPLKGGFGALAGIDIGIRANQRLDFKVGTSFEILPSPIRGTSHCSALQLTGGASIRF